MFLSGWRSLPGLRETERGLLEMIYREPQVKKSYFADLETTRPGGRRLGGWRYVRDQGDGDGWRLET